MALTVEELQIVLSCDASTAQSVLEKMDATVKAYTEKFQKYFNGMGGGKGGVANSLVSQFEAAAEGIKKQTKAITKQTEDWKARYEKTFGETFDSSVMKAKIRSAAYNKGAEYVPSGKQITGSGGMGDPNYYKNSAAYKSSVANSKPNGKLIDLGYESLGKLESGLERVSTISNAVRQKMLDARDAVREFGQKYVSAMKNSGGGSKAAQKAEADFKKAIYAADRYAQQLDKVAQKEASAKSTASSTGEEEPSRFRAILDSLSSIRSMAQSVGSSIKKAFQSSLLGRFLKQLGRTIMRMAAMKLIRGTIQGIQQGLQELAKTSASSSKAMNTITAAGGSIKMALGAAVMPIVKALAPLFVALASAINTAANAIARFFAVLTGQATYTATEFSGSLDGIAKSAGGAGKAAKGMLADFDELNVITSQSGGGGGGGGIESSLSKTVEDQTAFSKVAETIRKNIQKGDWAGVGKVLNKELSKISQKISTWAEKLKKSDVGKNVAAFLNGFFEDTETFEENGRAVGDVLVGLVAQVDAFARDFKPQKVVDAIVAFFKGFGKAVDDGFTELFGKLESQSEIEQRMGAAIDKWINDQVSGVLEDLDRMFNDTVTSLEEAGALIAKGWTNCMDTIVKVVSQLWEKVNAALGIAYEYIKAFFITLVDYIGTRGALIKANVDKFMNNIKIAVLEKLKDVIDGMSSGPLGKLLKLIGVDLAGASESLGKSIDKAKEKNKELDTKIGELQTKAKEGFDISANVDTTKVDSYKKTLASGWTVTVNPSLSKAKQLNKALGDALKVKVNIKYTNPVSGKTTSAGDISTSIVDSGMAKGGIAYGMTSAIIGEYAGASHNPEVVAPLNKLQGILERSNVGGKDTMTREQANTMINLLQRIEQKEMTVSPSVGFGQVVQRSLDAYSRA